MFTESTTITDHVVALLSHGLSCETGQVDFESTGGDIGLKGLAHCPGIGRRQTYRLEG
jgi:hypothetical protein